MCGSRIGVDWETYWAENTCSLCSVYRPGEYGDQNLLRLPLARVLPALDCYRDEAEHDLFVRRWALQRGLNPHRAVRVADRLRRRWRIHRHEEAVERQRRHEEQRRLRDLQLLCMRNDNRFLLDSWRRLGWPLPYLSPEGAPF